MTMNIFIVRHGESEMNVSTDISNHADYNTPLTKRGEEQAFESGKFLDEYMWTHKLSYENTLVFISPYQRAQNTFKEMNKSLKINSRNIQTEDLIIEQSYGLFHGVIDRSKLPELYPQEYVQYQTAIKSNGAFFTPRPYGESPFDVVKRANIFLNKMHDIIKNDTYENIIIVSHHNFIRCFLKTFLNKDLNWYYNEIGPDNCSIQLIQDSEYKGYIHGDTYGRWID